jgi:uncharacterized membrane protein
VWDAIRFFHLLAMAFFVGGQLVIGAAVVPVERSAPDRERMRAVARRFGYGTLVAIAVLVATGVAMASHFGDWGERTLQVKLALVGAVAALVAAHLRWPRSAPLDAAILAGSLAIVALGVTLAH